jgi:hypothetical protein
MAEHGAGVAETKIGVLVPIDASEAGAIRLPNE